MNEVDFEYLTSERDDDGVRHILLNRPERLNAMNRGLIVEVTQAFDAANADQATRAIVFSGNGRAFCAGDDRHEHRHPRDEAEAREFVELIQSAAVSSGRSTAIFRSGVKAQEVFSLKSR